MKLATVIVNYKTAHLVMQCLESLLPQLSGIDAQVIVVDNLSHDDSVTRLQDWIVAHDACKFVQVIEAGDNRGFSAGNNVGIRSIDADYYLLLNSDTIVRADAISLLLRTADVHREAGLISPRLEWPDGVPQHSCFRYLSPISEFIDAAQTGLITGALGAFNVPLPMTDPIVRPDWTSFACVLARGKLFREIGLLDESFFMYFEDVEFCWRARRAGWEIVHNPQAKVVHLQGGSSSFNQSMLERKRLPRYYYVSRTRYFYLTYGWFGLTLANILSSLGRCVSKCREMFERRKPGAPEKQWLDIWTNWLKPGAEGRTSDRST
jgi:hypothetical protein